MDLSFLVSEAFFDVCQMMVHILFRETNGLRNIPDGHGAVFKGADDFLPGSLFSFIGHFSVLGT